MDGECAACRAKRLSRKRATARSELPASAPGLRDVHVQAAAPAAAGRPLSPVTGAQALVQRQASSSSSSASSHDAGAMPAAAGVAPAAGPSCKIEVRATHIGGLLAHAPVWHNFVVYKDGAGKEWYFRGGPGGHCPGVTTGAFGTIHTNSGAYVAGTVDWSPGAPSVTVLSGASACGKNACLARELARIDGTCTPYHPTGPNSNTVAKTILDKCGMTPAKPVNIAPGWGDPAL